MNIPDTLFTGKNVIYLDQVSSTNTYALDLISKINPPEGTCIYTDYQSAGRGQIGRFWHSSAAKNLLTSYIFYPNTLIAPDQFFLNMISGLAVRDVVALFCKHVKIKWPNDIYVSDKKIAGILVQNILRGNHIKATVIGIGLNVNEVSFPSEIPNPTSLILECGIQSQLTDIRQLLSSKLEYYYLKLKANQLGWLTDQYVDCMYKRLEYSSFINPEGSVFNGEILGVDTQGKLIIRDENNDTKAYGFREIGYLI
jgi:BirA family biotin operon repressor/biotin-[acetyl-CoA-carboxylase] ligase